jgi:NAD(P)-dependent dehydrogenase (short-subunit alcohol dehydrogenase family)
MPETERLAVVTGANRGLGLETCRQLAQKGITVLLTPRSADQAVIAARQLQHTYGALRLCQTLIPLMNNRGTLVNVSSGMGQLSDMNDCCPAYRLSKTVLNPVTRIFSDKLKDTRIKVNSVCPGWVRTEMGGPNAPRSVEECAAGIVWAASLVDDGPSGGFFRDGKPIPW